MAKSHRGGIWRARRESNPQPLDPKSNALSIELRARKELPLYIPAVSPSTDSLSIQNYLTIRRIVIPCAIIDLSAIIYVPRLGDRHGYPSWVRMAAAKILLVS